jgi:hypothetical protein
MVFGISRKKTTDTQSEKPKTASTSSLQLLLALIIVVAAFLLIGVMLSIQYSTTNLAISNYGKQTDKEKNGTLIITEVLQSLDRSNQTLFNILLPVFGAWVGVVVTFFFASEQTKKAQEVQQSLQQSLVQALSPEEEKLSKIKVEDLLNKYPAARNVRKVTLDNTIKEVLDSFGDLSNVLVVDKEGKPLGILYKADLLGIFGKKDTKIDAHYNEPLRNHIGSITEDFIKKTQWSETGIRNYATLALNTTLLSATEKMNAISDQVNDVVGLVMDTNGIPISVVTYDMIVGYIK